MPEGITELRTVGEALTRAPAVYEDAGKPRRPAPPPVPPPPPRYWNPEEPPAFAGSPTRQGGEEDEAQVLRQRSPLPPEVPPASAHGAPRRAEQGAISLGAETLQAERARLEQARQLLAALGERVTDRLSVLEDFAARFDRVQVELRDLNDFSHRVRGENDALLTEIRKVLVGLTGAEGTSPEPASATATPPPAPTP